MAETDELALSHLIVPLLKGVVYRDQHEQTWRLLTELRAAAADHVRVLGLALVVDETEGFAFLRTLPESAYPEEADPPPRLIPRRQLSFHLSLLLALLRRRLAETDAEGSETRLILTRSEIVDMLWHFQPAAANEARLVDRIDQHIDRASKMGFLREVKGQSETWEVRRVLKAFVDAETLDDFEKRLDEYLLKLSGGEEA
jgi:hypothetical protein